MNNSACNTRVTIFLLLLLDPDFLFHTPAYAALHGGFRYKLCFQPCYKYQLYVAQKRLLVETITGVLNQLWLFETIILWSLATVL